MSADFNYASKYNKDANFSRVKFGADAPLLETELNEMQEIQEGKLKELSSTLLPDSIIAGSFSYASGTLTFTGVSAVVKGNIISIPTATFAVSEGQSVYIRVFEKEVNYETPLKKNGYESGVAITNNMKDVRIGYETSRRIAIAYSFTKDTTLAGDYLKLGTITSGLFIEEAERAPIVTNADREYWDEKAQYLVPLDTQVGPAVVTQDSEQYGIVEIEKIEGASYQNVTTTGNNILENKAVTIGLNGITYTVNADGTITATGTRTGTSYVNILGDISGTVTVFTFKANVTYYAPLSNINYRRVDGGYAGITKGSSFTPTSDVNCVGIYHEIVAGVTLPTTIYPYLTTNAGATIYEKFIPNSPSPEYPAPITNASNFEVVSSVSPKNLVINSDFRHGKNNGFAGVGNGSDTTSVLPEYDGIKNVYKTTIVSGYRGLSYTNTTLKPNDVYYVSLKMANSDSLSSVLFGNVVYGQSYGVVTRATGGKLTKFSTLVNVTSPNLHWYYTSATTSYVAQPMLVNLTEIYGAGNEPSLAWCDANIKWTVAPEDMNTTSSEYNKLYIPHVLNKISDTIYDSIEKQSDGTYKLIKRIEKVVLNGSESWSLSGVNTNTSRFQCNALVGGKAIDMGTLLCDKLEARGDTPLIVNIAEKVQVTILILYMFG